MKPKITMRKKTRLVLINSAIAGGLVLAGAFTTGQEITYQGCIAAIAAAVIVFLTKMRDYYAKQLNKKALKGGLFEFI